MPSDAAEWDPRQSTPHHITCTSSPK